MWLMMKKQNFRNLPKENLTYQQCLDAVRANWKNIAHIPENFKTKNLCYEAININFGSLEYIPKGYFQEDDYIQIIHTKAKKIGKIPASYLTENIYLAVLETIKPKNALIDWISKYLTSGICEISEAIRLNRTVVKRERDLEVLTLKNAFFKKESQLFIVEENFCSLKQERTFTNFTEFYAYLEENLNATDLIDYYFENDDLHKYNLDGANLNAHVLQKLGEYDDSFYTSVLAPLKNKLPFYNDTQNYPALIKNFSSNKQKQENQPVYYISDLHLDYKLLKLFPSAATKFEVLRFLKTVILQLWNSIPNPISFHNIDTILFGGDVSASFEITKLFYRTFVDMFHYKQGSQDKRKIIVVLGNHEILAFDNPASQTTLDTIIQTYKNFFDELGIYFLHNAVFVSLVDSEDLLNFKTEKITSTHAQATVYYLENSTSYKTLQAEELLKTEPEKLIKFFDRCNLIVLGGLGFSGYNRYYNATKKLYGNALPTLEFDVHETEKFEQIYQKLFSLLKNKPVIVLTHTPKDDWSKQPYNPNWIYVNGHTHRNELYISEGEKNVTVYADNQIGYYSNNFQFKSFCLSKHFDLFQSYKDGIYSLMKQEYLQFCWCFGMATTLSAIEKITMLKRDGYYLFLYDKKSDEHANKNERHSLFLLDGGRKIKLDRQSVQYYFDNMVILANILNDSALKQYFDFLEKISKQIKTIGGSGKIHGNIIDIDSLNHLYVNPVDGKMTPYFSPCLGVQYTYETLESLLQNNSPELYQNLQRQQLYSENNSSQSNTNVHNITFSFDTEQYALSRKIRKTQYLFEKKIFRFWNDQLLQQAPPNKKISKLPD